VSADELAIARGMSSIEIVKVGSREESQVLELLLMLYGASLDVRARHAWLYRDNPDGRAVTWLARDRKSGAPVAMTSLFPRRVLVHGAERRGAIGGDAYVRTEYRRRGIVTALHRRCMAEMPAAGVDLMYGPPEPHNLRALERVGSQVVARVRRYVRVLTPRVGGRIGARAFGLLHPRRPRVRIEAARDDDARVLGIWERARVDLPISPVRDAGFYAWRFARCPSGAQKPYVVLAGTHPVAAFALERSHRRSAIIDLVAPREAWDETIGAILFAMREDEAVSIKLNDRGPIARRLLRHGFVPRDAKPFQVLVTPSDWQAPLIRSRSWYYTTGDGDVDRVLA
jgi:Acetyltransferase (GNAT) domain